MRAKLRARRAGADARGLAAEGDAREAARVRRRGRGASPVPEFSSTTGAVPYVGLLSLRLIVGEFSAVKWCNLQK